MVPAGGKVTHAPFEVVRQGGQASTPILLPPAVLVAIGGTLNSAKAWLTANNNTVMMVLFVVLGAGISVVS